MKIFSDSTFQSWGTIILANERTVELYTDKSRFVDEGSVLRYIRGKRSSTKKELLQEFAAALQFPYYFGNNWDAFDECLCDLSWLPAKSYVVVVTSADALLEKNSDLKILLNLLQSASQHWQDEGKKMSFVFQCEDQSLQSTVERFEALGHRLPLMRITNSGDMLTIHSVE